MADAYQGKADDRRYSGTDVDITYSVKRCIHAAECVNRLPGVFDTQQRPWIQPDGASADAVAHTITLCPSGALHYDRKDGAVEATPETNRIILWHHGPLQIIGDLEIQAAGVEIEHETRATLCRCGASNHKPFCDNAHKELDFVAMDREPDAALEAQSDGGKLVITAHSNGPLEVSGKVTITDAVNGVIFSGENVWLCRCGGSASKPFCDSTHKKINFQAE